MVACQNRTTISGLPSLTGRISESCNMAWMCGRAVRCKLGVSHAEGGKGAFGSRPARFKNCVISG